MVSGLRGVGREWRRADVGVDGNGRDRSGEVYARYMD